MMYVIFCKIVIDILVIAQSMLMRFIRPNGDMYICGCGGSDYVSGDRLREGGDCESPEKITADPKRVDAAVASFQGISSLGDNAPSSVQV